MYYNNPERCLVCDKPQKLTGKLESRFGFAITSLGDLNKDGIDDIAIGAPYEDNGVVYIYLGSSNGLIKEPSQVSFTISQLLNSFILESNKKVIKGRVNPLK